jgi:hypothetical protein
MGDAGSSRLGVIQLSAESCLQRGDGRGYYEAFKGHYLSLGDERPPLDESTLVKFALGHLEDAAVDVIDLELERSIIEQVTTSVSNLLQELKYQEDSGSLTDVAESIEGVYNSFEESGIPLTRTDGQLLDNIMKPERNY